MNYHFRSNSEHHQPLQQNSNNNSNTNGTNNSNGTGDISNGNLNDNHMANRDQSGLLNPGGIIRVYSDSQQSLDRLFNPTNTQSTVPLRSRNLPASFFNPNLRIDENQTISLHSRSTSFDPRRLNPQSSRPNQINSVHNRTQSTLIPATGLLIPVSTNICSQPPDSANTTNGNGDNNTDFNQQPNNVSSSSNWVNPATAPSQSQSRQTNNYHYRNFSSPSFSSLNTANQSSNQFYRQSPHNANRLASHNIASSKPPIQNTSFNPTPMSPDINMTDVNFTQPPRTDNHPFPQPTKQTQDLPYYYPNNNSNPDIISSNGLANPPHASAAPYFTSNDSVQQQATKLNHSLPFVSYDSALGNSSGMLNPSSQTASSSSSSNENHSLLGIPTPAVHSRSCSFDGRSMSHPVAHIRSQSTIVGIQNSGDINQFTSYDYMGGYVNSNNNASVGDTKGEQTLINTHGSSSSSSYNPITLSPITDQGSVFDEWSEITM